MDKIAQFNIGDLVIHKHSRYRAIIVDVDPLFQASGRYNPQAKKREFATRNPWYRLLVDDSSQITYVEECMLIADKSTLPINNPNLGFYLKEKEGHYCSANFTH
ncbi:putative DNA-binding protein hemimethylated [Legionella sainthelensi]|uniref:Heat shock protein HspQ n=1 Tax=Legionella sainthelensi TaxID=28087 RepID=A0A0W0YMZ9_9GAMM|nr:heat shock protein HspQ [Legionella sainthelensi]KTD58219.1 putative DNA-binding protein hemimethylated [Legionella sainthelensi]VEH26848.1 putative DNA-binding protein hemimethylated [Legionella sainthelensi]